MTFNHNFMRHFCILLIFFSCFIFILIFKYFCFVFSLLFLIRISFFAFEKNNFKCPFDYYYNCWNNHRRYTIIGEFELRTSLSSTAGYKIPMRLIKTRRQFWWDRDIIIKMENLFDGFSIWKFIKNRRPFEKLANSFDEIRFFFCDVGFD